MQDEIKLQLKDAIIELHNIARLIEKEIGRGNLSDDIRNCADRVNVMITQRIEDVVC